MIVFKVWPGVDLNPCCEKDPAAVLVWLEEAEPGETIKIEVIEMTEEEYDKLPEYMGP